VADDPVGISVGSVTVTVVPDAADFARNLGLQITPQVNALGQQLGEDLADKIAAAIRGGVRDGLSDAPLAPATESGSRTGGAFANAFKDRVNAALRDLPDPRVGLDATELDRQLADIRARLKSLGDAKVGVDIDEGAALAEIEVLHAALVQLSLDSPEINVKVDAARALAELEAVRVLADSINSAPIGNEERSLTVLPELGDEAAEGFAEAAASVSELAGYALPLLATTLVPIGAAFIGAFAGAVTVLGALAGGLGVVALGAKGVAAEVSGEVTPAIHELQATAAAGLLPGVESSIHSLLKLLPEVDEFVGVTARTLGGLAAEASSALTGPFWQDFYRFIEGEAGPILEEFATILGNVAQGFAGLIVAFKPVTDEIGAGLEHLSEKFAAFGEGAGSNSAFQSFLSYVQAEGPQVVKTFEDVGSDFLLLVPAIAQVGAEVLKLADAIAVVVSKSRPGIEILKAATDPVGFGEDVGKFLTDHLGDGSTPTFGASVAAGVGDTSGFQAQVAAVNALTASLASLHAIQVLVSQGFSDDLGIPTFVEHVRSQAVDLARASGDVNDAITNAVKPAATTLSALTSQLAAAERDATNAEFGAIISHQQVLDANEYAKNLAEVAKETDAAASSAKQLADSIPADQAAKAQAEQLVAALTAKAKADDAAAKAAQKSANEQTKAYQQASQAAQTATGVATAAAQALVANFRSSTDALLQQVASFSSSISTGLTQGTSLSSIWQSLVGTDANGNPINPTLPQVQATLAKTLASVKSFTADLSALAKAGASQDLITQIVGLGDSSGDILAKQLLAAGATTIKGFSDTYSQLDKLTTNEGDHLASTFYGAGVTSMENLAKGMVSQFPQLQAALAPLIAELDAAFTITPTISYNGSSAPTSKSGGKNQPLGIGGTSASPASFTGDLYLSDGTFLGVVKSAATGVVTQRATAAQQLQDAGMPGSSLDHLLAT
jgi:hypothetical protein